MIGLREEPSEAAVRTYDPPRALERWKVFEQRYGMPFATEPKSRAAGTGRGCRAVVAASVIDPGSEWRVFRALQIANFTGSVLLDDVASIRGTLDTVRDIDADRIAGLIDSDDVVAEYERHRAEARSALGTPAEAQDKTATSEGTVRFTAPTVVFRRGDDVAYAGGWQPLLGYDTLLANFAPELERVPPPDSPEPLLEFFPDGLTTAEVAQLLAEGSDPVPDREAAAAMLESLERDEQIARRPVGSDAIWSSSSAMAHSASRPAIAR